MTTTVILPVLSDAGDIVESITSVLNNSVHPSNLCIITHESIDGKKIAAIDAFFKSCCGEPSSEEITEKYKINKTIFSDISLYKITVKEKIGQHPVCYLPDLIYDNTDIFLTITEGIKYKPDLIEKYLKSLSDPNIGAVYSDYILDDNYTFLQSMHIMMREMEQIIDIGFKKSIVDKKNSPFLNRDLIYKLYSKSIIGHIPEALFVA
jgi:hypothetical protein